jgi:hypothetical protein
VLRKPVARVLPSAFPFAPVAEVLDTAVLRLLRLCVRLCERLCVRLCVRLLGCALRHSAQWFAFFLGLVTTGVTGAAAGAVTMMGCGACCGCWYTCGCCWYCWLLFHPLPP